MALKSELCHFPNFIKKIICFNLFKLHKNNAMVKICPNIVAGEENGMVKKCQVKNFLVKNVMVNASLVNI